MPIYQMPKKHEPDREVAVPTVMVAEMLAKEEADRTEAARRSTTIGDSSRLPMLSKTMKSRNQSKKVAAEVVVAKNSSSHTKTRSGTPRKKARAPAQKVLERTRGKANQRLLHHRPLSLSKSLKGQGARGAESPEAKGQ